MLVYTLIKLSMLHTRQDAAKFQSLRITDWIILI